VTPIQEQIAQFRKMATDDPENELAHFRLGQLLLNEGQFADAAASFQRTLLLSPQFSRAFQLLGTCLVKLNRRDEAVRVLKEGHAVADQRGDNIPREEMAKMLTELGEQPPAPARPAPRAAGGGTGFRCSSPRCFAGGAARQLAKPPMNDALGREIYEHVCADCWEQWLRRDSIKVINEGHLDLSTEQGQFYYDSFMRETLGLV
jgi:Fe-S cluster biosynthesis and repair protein YggX